MTDTKLNRVLAVCCFVLMSMLVTGCKRTIIYNEPTEPVALKSVPKIDLNVELCLTETLQNAKHNHTENSNTYVQPLGGEIAAPCSSGTDVILIPALASVERDRPITIYSTQTTSMQFTWTLLDCEGNVLWATTIAGEGKGPMGSPFSKNAGHQQVDAVLQDVFGKSVEEMSASDVIRQYAASRK
jgi:hypothetical protein